MPVFKFQLPRNARPTLRKNPSLFQMPLTVKVLRIGAISVRTFQGCAVRVCYIDSTAGICAYTADFLSVFI